MSSFSVDGSCRGVPLPRPILCKVPYRNDLALYPVRPGHGVQNKVLISTILVKLAWKRQGGNLAGSTGSHDFWFYCTWRVKGILVVFVWNRPRTLRKYPGGVQGGRPCQAREAFANDGGGALERYETRNGRSPARPFHGISISSSSSITPREARSGLRFTT